MRERIVTVPDLILIAGTRVALGIGVGLLMSRRLREGSRKGAGWGLLAFGVLTTIPLVLKLRSGAARGREEAGRPWAQRESPAASAGHSPS